MAERVDNIGFGGLQLVQDPEEFCYGVDAVILADFAARHAGAHPQNIIDLGTGTGIIPLILSAKTKADFIGGLEIQEDSYERALRNARLNGLEDRVKFFLGDARSAHCDILGELRGEVDIVTCNPPYMQGAGGIKCANIAKSIARHETSAGLEDFFACASALLREGGEFFLVHRPSRLADICCFARQYRLEPKEMRFVSPKSSKAANIILVRCVKGGGKQLKILDPLFVYGQDGNYTKELRECYE